MEHVPHHEAVETLSRNTKLSRFTDPLKEVSMSWSNRSRNRSEDNTNVNAFTAACSNLSKEQSHAEDQLNTFTSTLKKTRMTAANHSPMNMTWISKENAKAGDELTISTSSRSPLSQKSTSHKNIRSETSSDIMKSDTCKSSCSKTIDILRNEISYLNEENKRLQESVQPKALFNLEKFSSNDKKILYYTGCQTYQLLMVVFNWILPSGDINDIAIHVNYQERVRQHLNKLTAKNQCFLTLVRLDKKRDVCRNTRGFVFNLQIKC